MDTNQFSKLFNKAREEREENRPEGFPVGRYSAYINEAFHNVSQGGQGREQIVFVWVASEDEEIAGQKHYQYQGLDHPVSVSIIESFLSRCGYDTSELTPESLDDILKDITARKPLCTISVTEKGEYKNVRINNILGFTQEGGEEEQPKQPEEVPDEPVKTVNKKIIKRKPAAAKKAEPEPEPEPEPEAEAEAEDGEDVPWEIGIGTVVKFANNNKQFEGEVVDINEDVGHMSIRSGAKVFKNVSTSSIIEIV